MAPCEVAPLQILPGVVRVAGRVGQPHRHGLAHHHSGSGAVEAEHRHAVIAQRLLLGLGVAGGMQGTPHAQEGRVEVGQRRLVIAAELVVGLVGGDDVADRDADLEATRTRASELGRPGVLLAAGESIEFIILDQSGKKKPEKAKPLALYAFEDGYDIEQYTEFALKAAETLLVPFGYDVQTLKDELGLTPPAPKKAIRRERQLHARSSMSAKQIPLFRMRPGS